MIQYFYKYSAVYETIPNWFQRGFLWVPLNIIIFFCSDHTFPYLNTVQAPCRIWNMQIARHIRTHPCVGGYEWIITMTCRRTKAANIKRNFITFAWVFGSRLRWAGGQLPRQLCCPAAVPLTPLPHIWVHIFGPWPNRVHRCRHSSPTEAIPTDAESERPTEPMGVSGIVCLFSFSHNYEKRYEKTQRQNVKNVTTVVWQTDARWKP